MGRVYELMTSGEHGGIVSEINGQLYKARGNGGDKGWWFASDVSIEYENTSRGARHDIAAWKKVNCRERPRGFPVRVKPDWICEVSFSSQAKDQKEIFELLESAKVDSYWIIDAKDLVVTGFKHSGDRFEQKFQLSSGISEKLYPFEDITIDVNSLFAGFR